MNLSKYGFIRVTSASPALKVADLEFNTNEIINLIKKSIINKSQFILFPELSITGYTVGDLFFQDLLIENVIKSIKKIKNFSKDKDIIIIIGAPLKVDGKLYNCAITIQNDRILGIVPKSFLCNSREYYEERWFSSEFDRQTNDIKLFGEDIPFGTDLIFESNSNFKVSFGIEICEDLWTIKPPSFDLSISGAEIIFNLSASNEYLTKNEYRTNLVKMQSARCLGAYVLSSCGPNESTTDTVFSGHCLIAETGKILSETEKLQFEPQFTTADIDINHIQIERTLNNSYGGSKTDKTFRIIDFNLTELNDKILLRTIKQHPFIPITVSEQDKISQDIVNLQSTALIKRLKHTNIKNAIIGISGGLDSTLALLSTVEAFKKISYPLKNIIAVSMPGPASSNTTQNNAQKLARALKLTLKIINIEEAVEQHLKNINHKSKDLVYENTQARERTQILMDLANKYNAIVIGTGDLSEIALGWNTYNGDHMSMYNINSGVPKTLVKLIVKWFAENIYTGNIKKIIEQIYNTPISPELLSNSKNKISQKTEEIIGPYILHDFYLYYFVRMNFKPSKILFLANIAFQNDFKNSDLKKYLEIFLTRFFKSQFKRSCMPDGVKIGTVSLSPRADWRMPSDAEFKLWIEDLENHK